MHLFFTICQAVGFGCAVGIRPFLPALLVGALAAGNLGIDFGGTDSAWLESPIALTVIAALFVGVLILERRPRSPRWLEPALVAPFVVLSFALGGGAFQDGHRAWLAGIVLAGAAAVLAVRALRPVLERARARLDAEAAGALPVYAEGAGLLVAGLTVLFPPVALLALLFLLALLLTARRREGEKYAGLRILR